jgi:hypothetical protein
MFTGLTVAAEADPFEGLQPPLVAPSPEPAASQYIDWTAKRELFSQFTTSRVGSGGDHIASRQSVGGELYSRFSTRTTTISAVDVQLRLVRRDHPIDVIDDPEAVGHDGWTVELHNCYVDLYNILNPFVSAEARSSLLGCVNLRIGRFYVPLGINEQTDTHGTVLQLSNDQDLGFERDWLVGAWGSATRNLNYTVAYLLGSGHDLTFAGQSGLLAARLSLANPWRTEHGIEAGIAAVEGERLAMVIGHDDEEIVRTFRAGPDARWWHSMLSGTLSLTGESAFGRDDSDRVSMALGQVDYLHHSRRWGFASQYRRYDHEATGAIASVFGEATWYFRNDVSGSFLHWIKLDIERQVERDDGPADTRCYLQYYRYW